VASRPLHQGEFAADPMAQFGSWYDEAAAVLTQPEAMALATADGAGSPSVRMVLLKSFDTAGFVFFTNYGSRKGRELSSNDHAAIVLYWEPLGRQVRATGTVERVSAEESDRYFASRPRASQLAAIASHQSEVLADRAALETEVAAIEARFGGVPVPRPEFWGGFRLVPDAIEFWAHRENRLHDRLRYRREAAAWVLERLAP
jgi:pyridoxamine 5'-phosphate oxidase